jgi:hypothetical protein
LNLKGVEKLNNAQIQERRGKKGSQEYGEMRKLNNIKDGQLMDLSMTKVGKLDNP